MGFTLRASYLIDPDDKQEFTEFLANLPAGTLLQVRYLAGQYELYTNIEVEPKAMGKVSDAIQHAQAVAVGP